MAWQLLKHSRNSGAKVAVLDLVYEECENVCRSITAQFGVAAIPLAVDLSSENDARSVASKVLDRFTRLDILVNCAAMVGTSALEGWAVPFLQQSTKAWNLALDLNLTAPFILTQICADALSELGHGTIVNIGSIYGMVGPNWGLYADTTMTNPAAYGASKGGLLQFTRYVATALAPKVRANMITPGGVFRNQSKLFTERYEKSTPLQRMATEEDFKGG